MLSFVFLVMVVWDLHGGIHEVVVCFGCVFFFLFAYSLVCLCVCSHLKIQITLKSKFPLIQLNFDN